MRAGALVVAFIAMLGSPVAGADEPESVPVQLCVTSKGLSQEALQVARLRIVSDLEAAGAKVSVRQGACCEGTGCAKAAANKGLVGLLEIHVLRFGPMIRITFRTFYTVTGKEVLHIKARAASKDFPQHTSLRGVLERALTNLRTQRRASAAKLARTKPKPPRKPTRKEPDRPPIARVDPLPPPEPAVPEVVFLERVEPESQTSWYWVGGGFIAGGAVLAGTGMYFLTGPMQDAIDTRNEYYQKWLDHEDTEDPEQLALYRAVWEENDKEARKYETLGWVLAGAGAAVAVGGVLIMLLGPDSPAPEEDEDPGLALRPVWLEGGGGFVLDLTW